jgi:uncharacterized protein
MIKNWLTTLLLVLTSGLAHAQLLAEGDIIKKPAGPDRPVYDLANVLSAADEAALEEKLYSFWDTTSTAAVVVTLNSVEPYAIDRYAYSIGEYWGVGTKEKDNGVVLLVAVKDREVFIASGYGVEGALPDATAKLIVENEILPNFRQNNYAAGINAGVIAIAQAAAGEYSKAPSQRRTTQTDGQGIGGGWVILLVLFFLFILPAIRASKYKNKQLKNKRGGLGWLATLMLMNQMGGGRGRGWDDFRGGGGIFGGGGGGGFGGGGDFGGFGGGSFGGGGAGGSW